MMRFKSWSKHVSVVISILFSLMGIMAGKAAAASPEQSVTENTETIAQTCPPYTKLQSYSRVTTRQGDPVNVRATPNGRVIGSIPNGWAVVPVKKDSSGRWIKVTNHYEIDDPAFGSAPDFKNGWVSAQFLKPLGKFCEKPMSQGKILRGFLTGQHPIVLPQWAQIGDYLARSRQS